MAETHLTGEQLESLYKTIATAIIAAAGAVATILGLGKMYWKDKASDKEIAMNAAAHRALLELMKPEISRLNHTLGELEKYMKRNEDHIDDIHNEVKELKSDFADFRNHK